MFDWLTRKYEYPTNKWEEMHPVMRVLTIVGVSVFMILPVVAVLTNIISNI